MSEILTIAQLTAGFSLEVSARNESAINEVSSVVPAGSDVYIPWVAGNSPEQMLSVAKRLRELGMNPVPHIPARHLKNEAELAQYLECAVSSADVRQVLLIGGDTERPAGPFEESQDILETGLLTKYGIHRVGLAGHPEGHPGINLGTLSFALKRKVEVARMRGLKPYVVSQFCFEAEPILDWLRKVRQEAIDVEVRVGLAGPASITTLMKFALRCGIGNSLRALSQHGARMARLVADNNPEHLIRSLASARVSEPALGISGFHFYPFGGIERLRKWLLIPHVVGRA